LGTLKTRVATPLAGTALLDKSHLEKLRAISVSTVEELLGLIAADPDAVGQFLEVSDLAQLQADAAPVASGAIMADFKRLRGVRPALGARKPAKIREEKRAEFATFESYRTQSEPGFTAGDPGGGVSLLDCCGPVRNQADRGTCVAHAVCAVLECLLKNRDKGLPDQSEQFVYWNAKEHDGDPDEEGTFLEVAMPETVVAGACQEHVWPYNPQKIPGDESQGPPPPEAMKDAAGFRPAKETELEPRDSAAIRDVLNGGRPVAVSIPVYDNWYGNPAVNTLGFIPMPVPNSVLEGGHAMCAVGFDFDDDFAGGGYFVLRNSWGIAWAPRSPIEPGYGVIPFTYIEKYGWEAYSLEM